MKDAFSMCFRTDLFGQLAAVNVCRRVINPYLAKKLMSNGRISVHLIFKLSDTLHYNTFAN
jgi:hypothetical protein